MTVSMPAVVDDEDDDSSDDGGPMPAPAPAVQTATAGAVEKRKRAKPPRVLQFEKVYLEQMPSAYMYEKSYLHRDVSVMCKIGVSLTNQRTSHVN
jgi:hypothetical protein